MAKKRETKAKKDAAKPANQRKKPAKNAIKKPKSATKSVKTEKIQSQPAKQTIKKETSSPEKKNPKITRPTPKEEAEILQRRNLVFDLRKAGASIRQISDLLKSKGIKGASVGQVQADWSYMLSLQYEEQRLTVEEYIEYEIGVIDDVQFSFYAEMKKRPEAADDIVSGEEESVKKRRFRGGAFDREPTRREAAEIVLSCVRERARLRNLYKPPKVKLDIDQELAKLLGVRPEELPDVDSSDC